MPQQLPTPVEAHGDMRMDPYYWMKDPSRRNAAVLAHLKAENDYFKLWLQSASPLRQRLEEEVDALVWQHALLVEQQLLLLPDNLTTEASACGISYGAGDLAGEPQAQHGADTAASAGLLPAAALQNGECLGRYGQYFYVRRPSGSPGCVPAGLNTHLRVRPDGAGGYQEHVVLDEQQRAQGDLAYALHTFQPSPDFSLAAFTEMHAPQQGPSVKKPPVPPPGVRAARPPDPCTLHVIHVATSRPACPPMAGTCGEVMWSACGFVVYFGSQRYRETWQLHVASGRAHRLLADPDDQPIQLVRAGTLLTAQSWGNSGVPREVWLLDQCDACGVQQQCGETAAVESGNPDGWVPPLPPPALLHRRPGLTYTLHDLDTGEHPAAGHVVWVRDLERPNGELRLLRTAHALSLLQQAQCSGGGSSDPGLDPPHRHLPAALHEQQQEQELAQLLVLLPHDPHRRIMQLLTEGGQVLLLLADLDVHGAPSGRYSLQVMGQTRESSGSSDSFVAAAPERPLVLLASHSFSIDPAEHDLQVVQWQGPLQASDKSMARGHEVYVMASSLGLPPKVWNLLLAAPQQSSAPPEALSLRAGGWAEVETRRVWARSHDGAEVPITLCYHSRNVQHGTPVPLLLRVYGAYGRGDTLAYCPDIGVLLKRGVVVALAHVRGGGPLLGPAWYEAGRGALKPNGWRDLLACVQYLVESGVTSAGAICLEASSAGGWVAGAALNNAPAGLFRAALLTVPSLDTLTALLEDPTYGPHELCDAAARAEAYAAVKAWSPYDNLPAGAGAWVPPPPQQQRQQQQQRPGMLLRCPAAVLVRVALDDEEVPFWEGAKYVARLRALTAADRGDAGGQVPASGMAGGRPADGVPRCMLQVKTGGHNSYGSARDHAVRAAFVVWALQHAAHSAARAGNIA